MGKDTELLKIQAYADYAHSRYTVVTSYILGFTVAYLVTVFGLYLQNFFPYLAFWFLILIPAPILIIWLRSTYKEYTRRMARVDGLIKKVNTMQSLPTIEEMINGKAWEKENGNRKVK
jgi:hypothetical protein